MLDGTSNIPSLEDIDSLRKEEDEEDISFELDFQEGAVPWKVPSGYQKGSSLCRWIFTAKVLRQNKPA